MSIFQLRCIIYWGQNNLFFFNKKEGMSYFDQSLYINNFLIYKQIINVVLTKRVNSVDIKSKYWCSYFISYVFSEGPEVHTTSIGIN